MFLTSSAVMTDDNFQIPENPTLCHLVFGLYKLVAARHHGPPKEKLSPYDPDRLMQGIEKVAKEEHQYAVKKQEERKKYLNDHSVMLIQFKSALNDTWPSSDSAGHRPLVASRSFVYAGMKRSRDMAEESGEFNEPSSSKRQC